MTFWKNLKTLVTGGCGFLGSYLVEELVASEANVSIADNLESGTLENIARVRDDVQFIEGDLRNRSFCEAVCKGVDVVMHLAGRAHGLGYGMNHPGEMLYNNTVINLHMLEAARTLLVKRFLLVSSSCVYPDQAPAPTPELEVMTLLPEKVNEGYGWAKRISELQATYYHQEEGMKIAICRPFNPYGGRDTWSGEKSHVFPALVKKIMDGENPLVVWGSGNQTRNFLHARDAAKLMMMVTERYACAKPVNIGYEDAISIAQLVALICKEAGKNPDVVFDTSKPEGRFRKSADATLLRRITDNYEPRMNLKDGIREMINCYLKSLQSVP